MLQDDKFLQGEGDAWFKRNEPLLSKHSYVENDVPLYFIDKYSIKPKNVLEVGCGNGFRLSEIYRKYGSKCIGVEPSSSAIADGKKKYPDIELQKGLVHSLPIVDKNDLVIVNYVLHWVSREMLLKSITEIDRVVSESGYLIVGDFLPDYPSANRYHHLLDDEVYTYKLDYSGIFLATGLYSLVARLTYYEGHEGPEFDILATHNNRGACTLLRKSYTGFYTK